MFKQLLVAAVSVYARLAECDESRMKYASMNRVDYNYDTKITWDEFKFTVFYKTRRKMRLAAAAEKDASFMAGVDRGESKGDGE